MRKIAYFRLTVCGVQKCLRARMNCLKVDAYSKPLKKLLVCPEYVFGAYTSSKAF